MASEEEIEEEIENYEIDEYVENSWKIKILASGVAIGAIVGLAGAFLITRRAEKMEKETAITPAEGIKIGVLLFGLLRSISQLGDEK
jgi:ABC-type Mn2+/Zn2+ transport system permease subunit